MEKQELKNKINEFCINKHFEKPFIKECVTEFIEKHIELYGEVISVEDLFKRLENNLDRITFINRDKLFDGTLGEYKGRVADNVDLNEIFIYFNENKLEISEMDKKMWNLYIEADKQKILEDVRTKREKIKSTLIHELTHCAYTIKDKYGIGEEHIFSKTGKNYLTGQYSLISGNNNNVEAIVNYISSRIEGKKFTQVSTYQAETQAIYMLAEKIDEKLIIQSAWNSNEQQFKQAYIESIVKDIEKGENSYNKFQDIMAYLVVTRKQNISIAENNQKNKQLLSELQEILDGKKHELEFNKFQDIERKIKTQDTISTTIPKIENKTTFTKKIAKFIEKHKLLMNNSIIKKFVERQLYSLPSIVVKEETNASISNNKKHDFNKETSKNMEYRKLKLLQNRFDEKYKLEKIGKENIQVISIENKEVEDKRKDLEIIQFTDGMTKKEIESEQKVYIDRLFEQQRMIEKEGLETTDDFGIHM